MADVKQRATPLHVVVAGALLIGAVGGVFWLLDPDRPRLISPTSDTQLPVVDLAVGLSFHAVNVTYRERKAVAGTPHLSSGTGDSADLPNSPMQFVDLPPPGLLTGTQKDSLQQVVLTELRRSGLLARVPPGPPTVPASGVLNLDVQVDALPDGLLLCRMDRATSLTVSVTRPRDGLAIVYLQPPAGATTFPAAEFFSTRARLYDDLTRVLRGEARRTATEAHQPRALRKGAFTRGLGGIPVVPPDATPPEPPPPFDPNRDGPPGGIGEIPAGPDTTPREITPSPGQN